MSTATMLGMSSPLEQDPAGYEIGVTIPDGVDVPKGGAKMSIANNNILHEETGGSMRDAAQCSP